MGAQLSRPQGLDGVVKRASSRTSPIQVTGRYHRLPRRIEDDYEVSRKILGSGYNGAVHLARSKATKRKFAVKGFKLHGISRAKREELETECEVFLGLDHPHVARLVDVYESASQLWLVMECLEGGELLERVQQLKRFSEQDAADAVWQQLLAVNYLHTKHIVHRDLKLENFLYDTDAGEGRNHLKLIDFGFSKVWDPNVKMHLSCGTLSYVAPEVLARSYDSKCDMWSLGVIAFVLLVGYMPFSGPQERQIALIKKGEFSVRPPLWATVSSQSRNFVENLLVKAPGQRLSAEQALAHPWIASRASAMQHCVAQGLQGAKGESVVRSLQKFSQASRFRRACMHVLAWSLTNEERSRVHDAFLAIDTQQTGTITLVQLRAVLEDQFNLTDAGTQEIFQALDSNNDDRVQYSDFLAAMVSGRLQIHNELIAQAFRRFDTDKTGKISQANLRSLLGESFDAAQVDGFILEADLSQDGAIDFEEFAAYLQSPLATPKHQHAALTVVETELRRSCEGGTSGRSCMSHIGPSPLARRQRGVTPAEDRFCMGAAAADTAPKIVALPARGCSDPATPHACAGACALQ